MPRRRQRARGEGSIYKDGNAWRYAVTLADGSRVKRRAKTEAEAVKAMRELHRQAEEGAIVRRARTKLRIGDWIDDYITVTPDLRPKTRTSYEGALKHRIRPYLGDLRREQLTVERLEQWLAELREAGFSSSSQCEALSILSGAFRAAIARGETRVNPCALVRRPRIEHAPSSPFTVQLARKVLDVAATRPNSARWGVAFACGLRPSEALGLSLDDVDLEAGTLRVWWQQQRRKGQGFVLVAPKSTAGVRTLALPQPLVLELRKHLKRRAEDRLSAGTAWQESGRLFCQPNGRPVTPEQDGKDWRALLEAVKVPHRRSYDTRHTAATLLAAQGVHPRVAQEILGHSSFLLTQRVYTHVMDESRREAADAMGVLWVGAEPGSSQNRKPRARHGTRSPGMARRRSVAQDK